MHSPYREIHRLMRRLQQKNRFIGPQDKHAFSLIETFFLLEVDSSSAVTTSELAKLHGIDQGYASRIANSLVKRNFLSFKKDKSDARKKTLIVSEVGKSALKNLDKKYNSSFRKLSAHLSSKEVLAVVRLFRLIADGYKHPAVKQRSGEIEYRVQQRRITRCFGLLGDRVYGSQLSSSKWQLLAEVVLSPVPPRPGELAELLNLAQNSLSTIVGDFEKEGFLERQKGIHDKRSSVLIPLPKGIKLYNKIESNAIKQLNKALAHLKENELQSSLKILRKFVGEQEVDLPPLSSDLQIIKVKGKKNYFRIRGFIARSLVELNLEGQLPESMVMTENKIFEVINKKGLTLAAFEVSNNSSKIICAGWKTNVSAWQLLSFSYGVFKLVNTKKGAYKKNFISFHPLKSYVYQEEN